MKVFECAENAFANAENANWGRHLFRGMCSSDEVDGRNAFTVAQNEQNAEMGEEGA